MNTTASTYAHNGKTRLIGSILLLLLVFIGYAPSLPAWFNGDDFVHVDLLSHDREGVLGNIWRGSLTGDGPDHNYRPLAYTAFYVFNIGDSALAIRLFVLLSHIAVTLLIYRILLVSGAGNLAAWGGAALFALYPALHTTVLWVSALGDVMATCFVAAAILLYIKGRSSPQGIGALLVCYLGAMLSKETGFVLPGLLMLFAWRDGRLFRDFRLWLALLILGVAVLMIRSYLLENVAAGPRTGHYFTPGMHTLLSLAKYAYSFAVPFPWHWTYQFPALIGVSLIIPAAIIALIYKTGWHEGARILLVSAGLLILPLLPVINVYANWYLYMPALGFAYACGRLLSTLENKTSIIVLTAVGVCFGVMTLYQSRLFTQAGQMEKRILSELTTLPESSFIVVGMPRQYQGVPMITFSHHLERALVRYHSTEKKIDLPATTALANMQASPHIQWLKPDVMALSLDAGTLNYFDLFRARGTPWKEYTSIQEKNRWGLPTKIELTLPDRRSVYYYRPVAGQPAFQRAEYGIY